MPGNHRDPHHPTAHITRRNDNESIFFKLPPEVRIMIYEFAVAEDEEIWPSQIADRSNKFDWKEIAAAESSRSRRGFISRDNSVVGNDCTLTVAHLTRVSQKIYAELEATPVFYRVNRFNFYLPEEQFVFLAAITPQRRGMIEHICLHNAHIHGARRLDHWDHTHFGSRLEREKDHWYEFRQVGQHSLSLLSQCVRLKRLVYSHRLRCRTYNGLPVGSPLHQVLPELLPIAQAAIDFRRCSLWNLSTFRVELILDDDSILLLGPQLPSSNQSRRTMPQSAEPHENLINQIRNAFTLRRSQLLKPLPRSNDDEKQQYEEAIKETITADMLREAIIGSKIDFPGEDRVTQNRSESLVTNVSSRTRQKCKAKADTAGVLTKRETPLINQEGHLTWRSYRVDKVLWEGDEVFSEVVTINRDKSARVKIESLLFDEDGFLGLHAYYQRQLDVKGPESPRKRLEQIRNIPSPRDIMPAERGGVRSIYELLRQDGGDSLHPVKPGTRLPWWVRSWEGLESQWGRRITELETELETLAKSESRVPSKKSSKKSSKKASKKDGR
ncbi:hypothetical protein F4778DRAFT_801449 [Xylariomycetidae sp. FL2044]|nr:hypothetical protein F4778DRAFT_801449 [Xylariomycetidae sp. FL2044]